MLESQRRFMILMFSFTSGLMMSIGFFQFKEDTRLLLATMLSGVVCLLISIILASQRTRLRGNVSIETDYSFLEIAQRRLRGVQQQ